MSVALYVTKIETIDPKTIVANIVIDCDFGRLPLSIAVDPLGGDSFEILDKARKLLERFGQELSNATRLQMPLRLSVPPQLK
jgi:hypothetical protein